MSVHIECLAIGDELLTGKITDSNSAFVGAELFRRGMRLEQTQVIADDDDAIARTLKVCGERADFVVCFGGLGPTSDDRTAQCVARSLGVELVDDLVAMERMKEFAKRRNRVLTPQLLKQVQYPRGTNVIANGVGLAPGFSCVMGRARFFFLPGVPFEMKPMFLEQVLPVLEERLVATGGEKYLSQVWKCLGIPESELQRLMDPVEAALPKHAWLGYRTKFPENHLVLYWRAKGSGEDAAFAARVKDIGERLGSLVYTETDDELENLVLQKLKARNLTLAVAESCTGGLCAQRLTKVPGASENFWGGVVVYQVDAKASLLGVELADPQAAVSADCSLRLARALKEKSGCSIAAAVTGYMGPAGGTEKDPLGTSYIAIVGDTVREYRIHAVSASRELNQWGSATHVLNGLRLYLDAL